MIDSTHFFPFISLSFVLLFCSDELDLSFFFFFFLCCFFALPCGRGVSVLRLDEWPFSSDFVERLIDFCVVSVLSEDFSDTALSWVEFFLLRCCKNQIHIHLRQLRHQHKTTKSLYF